MKRWLFNILSALSLVMCVATMAVWARSYWMFGDLCRAESQTCTKVVSGGGRWHLQFAAADGPVWKHVRSWDVLPRSSVGYTSGPYQLQIAGFAKGYRTNRFGSVSVCEHNVVVPYWALAALSGVLPAALLWRLRCDHARRERGLHGLCPKCGYDLRASKERCPECGTAIPAGQVAEGT